MAYTTKIDWEPLRSIDSATLTGGVYAAVGTALANPSYKLKLVNNSSVLVTISRNGTSDIDVAPANSVFVYDENTTINHESVAQGTQIYVKAAAAGTGLIYLVSQFIVQR